MTDLPLLTHVPPRRSVLRALATLPILGSGLLHPVWAQGTADPARNAQAWRAMSRVGYGPSAALAQTVQGASSPRDWALAQVDAAYAASQQTPRIPTEWAGINAPLPELFAKFREERQERAKDKGKPKAKEDKPSRQELLAGDPEYFSRSMALQAVAWRLYASSQPDAENPLLARLTEFWFNHFNVYIGKGAVRPFTGHYAIHVARAHALGKFEDLVLASARHPAMLAYLDQAQSVAENGRGPMGKSRGLNENYARELMELHTLGVHGGYTQTDVRELARVLTGWTVGPQDSSGFRFVPRLHDTGSKTVLGKHWSGISFGGGEQEGVEAIRMLARHPSTAQRICLRLAQFFIADQPAQAAVQALVSTFSNTGGDLRAVMRTLLQLPDVWQAENSLFKTPMDYACSVLTATDGARENRNLMLAAGFLANAGQPVHGWQTPDGYAFDAATWLVPEALTRRADFALAVARQANTEFLTPYLSAATLSNIAQERPALRAGLMLASPDFMRK
ncbi:DUF1800 domain-containing protein [uncultured Rhodoferax sp.]|uniref:DUF1800 domain-containing protein n=1 Tax=uncultured Rhodoferax sp. TaxID=223188 RepID=UPI0025F4651E|nr:DUF1800 domain-containing protein [uncultured Rhodoferax sp.]